MRSVPRSIGDSNHVVGREKDRLEGVKPDDRRSPLPFSRARKSRLEAHFRLFATQYFCRRLSVALWARWVQVSRRVSRTFET